MYGKANARRGGASNLQEPSRFGKRAAVYEEAPLRAGPMPFRALAAIALSFVVFTANRQVLATDEVFTRALEKGPLASALVAFAGGLLTAATPCVYPMIAITVSIFWCARSNVAAPGDVAFNEFHSRDRRIFTPLLWERRIRGACFGAQLANRWVIGAVIAIFVALCRVNVRRGV